MTNYTKFKEDLKHLLSVGNQIKVDLTYRLYSKEDLKKVSKQKLEEINKLTNFFETNYQSWYTESLSVIKLLIPDRLSEFSELYKGDGKRKDISLETYTIQDWHKGIRSAINKNTSVKNFDDFGVILMGFQLQYEILASAERKFESSLFDIKQLLQADLFDSEIEASKELLNKGFYRAGGVICGVVIERHLSQVCNHHNLVITKKNPTISIYNDTLKDKDIIDIKIWRFIQRLGDLRNLCSHNKEKEPTKEDIIDLIEGTSKLIKTVN